MSKPIEDFRECDACRDREEAMREPPDPDRITMATRAITGAMEATHAHLRHPGTFASCIHEPCWTVDRALVDLSS